ncbi:TOBE domain-containing protein [uncultured Amphritea sp.]|uniref:TOBE domain-containing protein n=1 Tax=uncultured Amphritea sp. TaxID=981605 RepID=UPI00261CE66A|nr:TOBE domain-containing protein [uncultured Amphritea sp.]
MKKPVEQKQDKGPLMGRGRKYDHLELLEQIDACGSITAAANLMGMSYKTAWDAVEAINNLAEAPLVERRVGGRNGGGAVLTVNGRRLVSAYRRLDKERERVLSQLNRVMEDFESYYKIIRRYDMKTSARNQFLGKIKRIKTGEVNAEVVLDIGGGDEIVSNITCDSVEHLELKVGDDAYAMIKSSWVILTSNNNLKTSSRNKLTGKVVRCHEGAVNAEVIIELPGGKTLTAIVTNESVTDMGLKIDSEVTALIKSSNVILAVAC